MCQTCPHHRPYQPTVWFSHIWNLYQLQQGGYPFEKNDLELTEWLALAEMQQAIDTPPETPTTP